MSFTDDDVRAALAAYRAAQEGKHLRPGWHVKCMSAALTAGAARVVAERDALKAALLHAFSVLQSMSCEDLPEDHEDREYMRTLESAAKWWPELYGPILAALSPKEPPR